MLSLHMRKSHLSIRRWTGPCPTLKGVRGPPVPLVVFLVAEVELQEVRLSPPLAPIDGEAIDLLPLRFRLNEKGTHQTRTKSTTLMTVGLSSRTNHRQE